MHFDRHGIFRVEFTEHEQCCGDIGHGRRGHMPPVCYNYVLRMHVLVVERELVEKGRGGGYVVPEYLLHRLDAEFVLVNMFDEVCELGCRDDWGHVVLPLGECIQLVTCHGHALHVPR